MDQSAEEHPSSTPPPDLQPASPAPSDRGLMILVIVLGLAFMAFVILAGVVGLTP